MIETVKKRKKLNVTTEIFEGPLDLLLHLIRKKNLDIYDIQIASITSEYLIYIEAMKNLDFDNVGDFLVMASLLMRLKAKTLLPSEEEEVEDTEELEQNLIERILEYKKYKESTEFFRQQEELYKDIFGTYQYPVREFGETIDATLFDLIDAFQDLISSVTEDVKDIITEEISMEDKIRFILSYVENKGSVWIEKIVEKSVFDLIVTLLAILELIRTHQIRVTQERKFGKIFIEKYESAIA